jgi:predicted MFS family arabinose efflux permease
MESAPATRRFAPTALMIGNIVTGCSVLAPAGMLGELSSSLDVTIRTTGLLITFGAVVLYIGSPLTAWLTGRIERRRLLAATLGVLAFGLLFGRELLHSMGFVAAAFVVLAVALVLQTRPTATDRWPQPHRSAAGKPPK